MDKVICNFEDVIRNGITVGGIHYRIVIVDEMAGNTIGEANYERDLITLKRCEPQRMQETLLHEIMHIIFYHSGFDEHNERDISSIATWLYAVLKQNKEVFFAILNTRQGANS
ncbi:hypothetical protein [Kosmotoga pacifica]|uniref:IrrE N-terminal-like domain-containing protein n=1 Tax=Kosmotoga pacifica TaxID=1330330 RepID=A0A0G2ZCT1_9BACT|nr:hypothetical protein [Kosmotoga pacifica]AKI96563.1 hypothetical protein IX53_00585 [Kosmotoga pacifica]